jgi:protein-tyrosine phosphatase
MVDEQTTTSEMHLTGDVPMADRAIKLEGIFNLRDLGGLKTENDAQVLPGLIFRGDSLHALTESDRKVLLDDLHIKTIIDLRTAEESDGDGLQDQRAFPGLEVHNFSIVPEGRIGREPFPSSDPEKLAARYLENLEEGRDAIRDSLSVIAESAQHKRPTIFHCAAGRDRTGLLAGVLLSLADVRDDEIIADYVASNRNADQVTARLLGNPLYSNSDAPDGDDPVLLRADTMKIFLDLLRSRFGGTEAWALGNGTSTETITTLKTELLVKS